VPAEIAGLGSSAMKPRVSPGFDPLKAQVGPDEYFVLSRIDGKQSIREILLATGLPVERGIAIITKLRSIGALLLPGESSAPVPMAAPARTPTPRAASHTPLAPMTPPTGVPTGVDLARAPTVSVTPAQRAKTPTPMQPPSLGRTPASQRPPSHPPANHRAPSQPPERRSSPDLSLPPRASSPDVPVARGSSQSDVRLPAAGRTPSPQPGKPQRITPPQGSRAISEPSIARTATPHTPMPASKLPARTPPTPGDVDPPTEPRTTLGTPGVLRPPAPDAMDAPTVLRATTQEINLVLPNPTAEERRALGEPGELGPEERLRILAMARLVDGRDPWALLGVPNGSDAKMLKRAYFKLSKEIHPDRYFGKQLGSFKDRLSVVFEAVSRAYARLTSPEKDRRSAVYQAVTEQPQTPGEYAGELFERACGLEVGGDVLGAMKLFAAAVRIDPQTRYLRRAASCALAAEQPKTAVEYAKKAQAQSPSDPSAARLLAAAFKATGRFADAEEVLVMAMALKNENDVLTAELRNDLAEVRRLMSG
jgi:hypothetical protein